MENPSNIQKIIASIQTGDLEAFDEFYELYFTPIYRFIFYRLLETGPAEDITQETFFRFLKTIKTFDSERCSPKTYLIRIAKNLIIDRSRKEKHHIIKNDLTRYDSDLIKSSSVADDIENNEDITYIEKIILDLPKNQKDSLVMKFIVEMSYKDIADELEKNESTIRQYVCRALKTIREKIKTQPSYKNFNILKLILFLSI